MGRDCWWTPEHAEYIADITKQHAAELVSKEMGKMARDFNRTSGSGLFQVKMDVSSPRVRTPMPPEESELEMRIIEFTCCGEHIKYSAVDGIQNLCCIICGKDSPVSV